MRRGLYNTISKFSGLDVRRFAKGQGAELKRLKSAEEKRVLLLAGSMLPEPKSRPGVNNIFRPAPIFRN